MATFKLIVNNILKVYNNIFLLNYKEDGIDGFFKIVFPMLFHKEETIRNKFLFFKEGQENFLIKNNKEKEFIEYFCKIQKVYHILNRFIYNYKYKKARIVVNTDMCMNELHETDKKVICVFHNQSKYLFHINDLIQIINTSLTNSSSFFADPKSIKNPYDNLPFNKSTLYNIYFYIKFNTDYTPDFLNKFFDVDFNLSVFRQKNVYILRQYSIHNYVYKSASNILLENIRKMITYFNQYCKQNCLKNNIEIDNDFPNDKLIKVMQPYLLLYIMSQFSYLEHEQKNAKYYLNKSLLKFNNFNPKFGRKRYKIITKFVNFKRKSVGKIIEFDDKHIQFNNIEKQNDDFLSDHLICEEHRFNERHITRTFLYLGLIYDLNEIDEQTDDDTEYDDGDEQDEEIGEEVEEDEEEEEEEDEEEDEELEEEDEELEDEEAYDTQSIS
jgi:hypothetical protein